MVPGATFALLPVEDLKTPVAPVHSYFSGGYELLEHLSTVHQTREFLRFVLHQTGSKLIEVTGNVSKQIGDWLKEECDAPKKERTLTPSEAEVLRELLTTIQGSNYIYKGTVTKDGQEAVCALKCAVFGSDQLARNVLELVAFHSVTKAGVFKRACLEVLKELTSPYNCFSMLLLGHVAGVPELTQHAARYAAGNIADCLLCDFQGFLWLEEPCLAALLRDRLMQKLAPRIMLVDLVLQWVQFRFDNRQNSLAPLLEQGAQLHKLTQRELRDLDKQPLVCRDAPASRLVAETYLKKSLDAAGIKYKLPPALPPNPPPVPTQTALMPPPPKKQRLNSAPARPPLPPASSAAAAAAAANMSTAAYKAQLALRPGQAAAQQHGSGSGAQFNNTSAAGAAAAATSAAQLARSLPLGTQLLTQQGTFALPTISGAATSAALPGLQLPMLMPASVQQALGLQAGGLKAGPGGLLAAGGLLAGATPSMALTQAALLQQQQLVAAAGRTTGMNQAALQAFVQKLLNQSTATAAAATAAAVAAAGQQQAGAASLPSGATYAAAAAALSSAGIRPQALPAASFQALAKSAGLALPQAAAPMAMAPAAPMPQPSLPTAGPAAAPASAAMAAFAALAQSMQPAAPGPAAPAAALAMPAPAPAPAPAMPAPAPAVLPQVSFPLATSLLNLHGLPGADSSLDISQEPFKSAFAAIAAASALPTSAPAVQGLPAMMDSTGSALAVSMPAAAYMAAPAAMPVKLEPIAPELLDIAPALDQHTG